MIRELSFWQLFLSLTGRTQLLLGVLLYIPGGGCMTNLHSIRSVTWWEQGLWYNHCHLLHWNPPEPSGTRNRQKLSTLWQIVELAVFIISRRLHNVQSNRNFQNCCWNSLNSSHLTSSQYGKFQNCFRNSRYAHSLPIPILILQMETSRMESSLITACL